MFRKLSLVPLILSGFVLFAMAGVCFAGTSAKLEQSKSKIISLIEKNNFAEAQLQTQKLIADFSGRPDLPETLYLITERYEWSSRFEEAKSIYQQIIQKYPNSSDESKSKLYISKADVMSLIMSQDYKGAEEAFNKLVSDFAEHPELPETIYWIAEKYGWELKFDQAKQIYQQIIQKYPDSPWADKAKIGAAKAGVLSLIYMKNYNQAEDALNKMVSDFSEHPDLPETLYWVAERYGWSLKFEDAKRVYQQIIREHPKSSWANRAKLGISKADVLSLIVSGDYDRAEAALNKMVADFSGHPDLPEAIIIVGDRYDIEGIWKGKAGLAEQSETNFKRAAEVWSKGANGLPDSDLAPQAYCRAGDCYLKLGKYEESLRCFQKVADNYPGYEYAWHALHMVGRNIEGLKESGVLSESEANPRAEAAYRKILEKYPDCPAAEHASRWLSHKVGVEKEK